MHAALLGTVHLAAAGQPGPGQPGAPAIPDGVYPMGFQGYVKGTKQSLVDLNRDWNFSTDGFDLSGFRIHGKVVWPAASGTGTPGGDGFEIIGADTGTSANALLDCNTHFTQTFPTFKNFTILPTVPTVSTNGFMGNEATLFNFDISGMGGDTLSPNNLNGLHPLNLSADWGVCHDLVYYVNDGGSHADGTHNDDCQVPGGTIATFTRIYMTGITHPTKGDGAYLRTHGPNGGTDANVPRPKGQQNSAIQITQNVSHVGTITYDRCRFGGGLYATINLASNGNAAQLGPIYVTNSLFDGNSIDGNDIGGDNSSSPGTNLVQSGNTRIDGKALVVSRVVA